jgi:hypothetical protein
MLSICAPVGIRFSTCSRRGSFTFRAGFGSTPAWSRISVSVTMYRDTLFARIRAASGSDDVGLQHVAGQLVEPPVADQVVQGTHVRLRCAQRLGCEVDARLRVRGGGGTERLRRRRGGRERGELGARVLACGEPAADEVAPQFGVALLRERASVLDVEAAAAAAVADDVAALTRLQHADTDVAAGHAATVDSSR